MPKEFAKLQAQDMGKVGTIQDPIRGIEKILNSAANKETVAIQQPATKYAISRGIQVAENGNSCWWSRSSAGNAVQHFYPVLSTGMMGDSHYAATPFIGVRPAPWIKLDLLEEQKNEFQEEVNKQKYEKAVELLNNNKFDQEII